MSLNTNFNVNPYYDDFDEDKKFLRMLFKPGYAVQARELTQLQTILQNQVKRFGNNIFKNGSLVTGGQTFIQDATYLKLSTDYAGSAVVANNFTGMSILDSTGTKRGEVVVVYDANAGTGDPKTLMVKQVYGNTFTALETIRTDEAAPVYANIATSGVGTGQVFSVNEGVFYYDGFFIKNDAQTIALSKYDNTSANVRIGFEIQESTVVYTQDTSLLDPAQDASNFQAPGSDRYKINLVLASRSLTSSDDTQFIELARVESGVLVYANKYPLYAVLEDTLARRTYDESGNYTVRPFKLSLETSAANTAKANVTLSPGKAYVYGYEFETIAPTTITVDKPRTTSSVNNKRLSADYGYYVYSNTQYGSFPINSLQTIDLHCVANANINVTTTGAISNTKIGTARVKTIEFETAANTSNSATYIYRTYLFDVSVGTINGGNCNNGISSTNTTYLQLANTLSGSALYSTVDNAYTGAKLRITAGPGVGETPKTIMNYKGSTQTIQISQPFIANVNSASTWAIDFGFPQVQSLAITSSTTRLAAADIDPSSKNPSTTYYDSVIADTTLEPLIFPLGEDFIANNTIGDLSFSYRRLYESQSFSSSVSPTLSVGTGESVSAASSTSSRNEKYQIAVTSAGTSPYKVGQLISADLFTVDTGTRKITVTNANNMVANITGTIDTSNPSAKSKTYVAANTTIQSSSGTSIFANNGVILYASQGQTHIMANTLIKTVDTPQSLFVSDVIGIVSVLDFNGYSITTANTTYATEIKTKYALDNGQRDSYYGHAAIKLIPGNTPPTGPLAVLYNRFSSSGAGYFDVDSYNGYDYGSIPQYTAKATGQLYNLRDCLDFRPVRATPTSTATANTVTYDVDSTTTGPKIPENGSDILLDYQYYLPRIDKIALNKNRTFEVIQGVPSLTPVEPKDKDGSMTMYILHEPAYVANTSNISVQYIDNRRFTMKDIGTISKRVDNLEYYTSLSLLEQSAVNKQDLTILDSTNLPRFKNGILVDSFNGHSVADVSNRDYKASIDPNIKELRPSFNISSSLLTFDAANSTNYLQTGPIITASSTQVVFVDQNKASRSFNINPFNVINYLGKINLDPPSDIWVDTNKRPDVLVNLQGDKDAWNLILASTYNYEWGDWSTYWTGQSVSGGEWIGQGFGGQSLTSFGTQTTTTTSAQTRSGIATNVVASTITQSLGDRVLDVSIIPYMRNRNVLFTGSSFKPTSTLYGFFDNVDVNNNIVRLNKFTLNANNLQYQTQVGNLESVTVYNNTTSTSNGTALIALTSNTEAFIVSVNPYTAFNIASANLVGTVSGSSIRINGYDHYNGNAASAAANTITLRVDATGSNNITTYVGSPIYIVSGTGSNQKRTISAYNSTTRVATVNTNWTTVPDSTSIYSIGNLTTSLSGDVAGLFYIPTGQFRVGEKHFRLIDTPSGDVASSSTNGDATFFAQGLLERTENTIISTTVPTIQRVAVNDNRVVTSTTSRTVVTGYYDPLAQTFLVSQNDYPDGLFLSKARFCFKSKDASQPITLQLRSTVNGYPSSSVVFPFSTVTLTPDQIKTSSSPDLDNADTYTEFVFDAPIYVQPGEYAFVLMTNSNGYETYAAEVGAFDTVSKRQISAQPYGGSFFLSQNGSTWVAEQNTDMMFRMYRHSFNTGVVSAKFKVATPSANTPYDLLHFMSSEVVLGNTSVRYTFNSEKATGGMAGEYSITPFTDYPMNDISDRRVLNPTTGNSTLTVTATMYTNSSDISPFLDSSRYGVIAVENIINNLPLSNSDIVLSSGGTAYSTNANAVVTITGGGGSGATAAAVVSSNVITSIYLTSAGSGYTTSPTITVVDANTTPGTGVTVTYNGEDKKSGGNGSVRYITRKVTLADGFDSGDLRIYLTAYKPSGSNILVYYKLLSTSDTDDFDNKGYQLMAQLSNSNFVSTNYNDYREIAYAPGYNITANNSVNYVSGTTTFNSFRTFAIKIVMTGTSTTDVPKIRDFRSIALPAGR